MLILAAPLSADERADHYYATFGNYYNTDENYWYNGSHSMYTKSGFVYNATPNGGDYVKVTNSKAVAHDYVTSYVKNAGGSVAIGLHNASSTAQIGALRGTDYHKFKE